MYCFMLLAVELSYCEKFLEYVAGDLGRMLDSAAICTDFQKQKYSKLTLEHGLQVAASLRGCGKLYWCGEIHVL